MDCDSCNITAITKGEKGDPGAIGPIGPIGTMVNGWKLNGNTEGSEKYFGTNDNFDIPLRTNNVVRGVFNKLGDFGFGESTVDADTRVHIKGFDATASYFSLKVKNSANSPLLFVRNDGNIGVGIAAPTAKFQIKGISTLNGDISFLVQDSDAVSLASITNKGVATFKSTLDGEGNGIDNYSFASTTGGTKISVYSATGATSSLNYFTNGVLGTKITETLSYYKISSANRFTIANATKSKLWMDGSTGYIGIGDDYFAPSAALNVKGIDALATTFALKVDNGAATPVNIIKARNDGYVISRAVNAAIADADLAVNEMSSYINEAGNTLIFKVKYSTGVVKTTSLALA